jgi:RND family efflux transporter MFP subunit
MRNLILTGLLALSPLALHAQTIAINEQQQQMLGIKTETLQGTDTSWSTSHPASVQVPNDQLRVVSTPVPGVLERLEVAEGASVKAGDVLAVIMSPTLLDQQRNYLDALTNLSFASAEMKRDRELDKEGIISKRRFLETQNKYIRAKTDAEQAKQLLELAGLDQSELDALASKHQLSGKLKIRSPLDGVVLEQMAVPGQRLEALDAIYRVGHLNPLWLEIHAPLEEVAGISKGDQIQVKEPDITGRVITVGRMVHGEDQGVMVRAEITEKTELLRPGQFVQVSLASTSGTQQFRIPRSAMVRQDGKTWIFIKTNDGFEPREVAVVTEEQSDLIVRGEIRASEQLAVSGTSALKAAWQEGKE